MELYRRCPSPRPLKVAMKSFVERIAPLSSHSSLPPFAQLLCHAALQPARAWQAMNWALFHRASGTILAILCYSSSNFLPD